jgi:hypothetical protein
MAMLSSLNAASQAHALLRPRIFVCAGSPPLPGGWAGRRPAAAPPPGSAPRSRPWAPRRARVGAVLPAGQRGCCGATPAARAPPSRPPGASPASRLQERRRGTAAARASAAAAVPPTAAGAPPSLCAVHALGSRLPGPVTCAPKSGRCRVWAGVHGLWWAAEGDSATAAEHDAPPT